jgi:acyl carrier protein
MSTKEPRVRIEYILHEQLHTIVPDPETNLLDSGLLDSLKLVELLAAIEREFGIVVDLSELDFDDVRTVSSITRFVGAKLRP